MRSNGGSHTQETAEHSAGLSSCNNFRGHLLRKVKMGLEHGFRRVPFRRTLQMGKVLRARFAAGYHFLRAGGFHESLPVLNAVLLQRAISVSGRMVRRK